MRAAVGRAPVLQFGADLLLATAVLLGLPCRGKLSDKTIQRSAISPLLPRRRIAAAVRT